MIDTPSHDVEAPALDELSTLQASCDGPVHLGTGPRAAAVLDGRWDHHQERPVVVVVAQCVHDVGVAVRFAARLGWGVTLVGPGSIWRRSEVQPTVAVVVDRLRTLDVEVFCSDDEADASEADPGAEVPDGDLATPASRRGWTARVGASATCEDLRRHLEGRGFDASILGGASGTIGQLTVDGLAALPSGTAPLMTSVQVVDGSGRARWIRLTADTPLPAPDWILTAVELQASATPC